MLDTAFVNAKTITRINSRKDGKVKGETFKMLFDIAMKLCKPCLRYRLEHSKGLSTKLHKEIASLLGTVIPAKATNEK